MNCHSRFFFARFYEASGASARNQNFAYSRRNCFAPFFKIRGQYTAWHFVDQDLVRSIRCYAAC